MTGSPDDRLHAALKEATALFDEHRLERDLWPRMRSRLDERSVAVSRLDWALTALLIVLLLAFPRAIPALLYHL